MHIGICLERHLPTNVCISCTLQMLEEYWLAKSPFLGGDEISVADLLHCCELDQLCLLDGAEQVIKARHGSCMGLSQTTIAACLTLTHVMQLHHRR